MELMQTLGLDEAPDVPSVEAAGDQVAAAQEPELALGLLDHGAPGVGSW
jgi:hypothetical protein